MTGDIQFGLLQQDLWAQRVPGNARRLAIQAGIAAELPEWNAQFPRPVGPLYRWYNFAALPPLGPYVALGYTFFRENAPGVRGIQNTLVTIQAGAYANATDISPLNPAMGDVIFPSGTAFTVTAINPHQVLANVNVVQMTEP